MSYNGSGTFNINTAGQPVVTGTVISSTAFNALTADLATGLSTAITKDGQTTTTARILFAQGISSTLTTDATSSTTGSIITAGGISCQKALNVGTTIASTAHTITDTSANSLAVGRQGATNPVLNVDASTASVVTGLNLKGAAAAGGMALSVTSSGTNENLTIDAKGSGTITLNGTATGTVSVNTKLGIGMSPTNILDITQSQNAASIASLKNSNTGAAALAYFAVTNGTSQLVMGQFGTNYTTSGINRQNGGIVQADGAGGLTLNTGAAQPIYFGINNVQYGGLNASGYLKGGPCTGAAFTSLENRIVSDSKPAGGTVAFVYDNGSNSEVAMFMSDSGGYNAAACVLGTGKILANSRSINAAGTINASGADYAEYEIKADGCGVVAKGQIIGFDIDGKVTDKWADALSFGVKSTDPNLVGGDVWGSMEALGYDIGPRQFEECRPVQPSAPIAPVEPQDASEKEHAAFVAAVTAYEITKAEYLAAMETYADALAEHEAYVAARDFLLEEARQKVDRIAYSGKVPVNVTGAQPGDYIIAVQDGAGISGKIVTNPTFDQYRNAVGRVRKIQGDGRAQVAVIVH